MSEEQIHETFFENGIIKTRSRSLDGKIQGLFETFDEEGNIFYSYVNGKEQE